MAITGRISARSVSLVEKEEKLWYDNRKARIEESEAMTYVRLCHAKVGIK
jgi:hypothetical protein